MNEDWRSIQGRERIIKRLDSLEKKVSEMKEWENYLSKGGLLEQVLENIEKMKKTWDGNIESFLKQVDDKLQIRDEQIAKLKDSSEGTTDVLIGVKALVDELKEEINNPLSGITRIWEKIEQEIEHNIDKNNKQLKFIQQKYFNLEEVLLNFLKVFNDEYFCNQEWYEKQLEKLDSNKKDPSFETKGYISLKLSRKVDLVKLDTLIHSIHRRAINDVIDFDSFVWQDFAEVLLKADGSWDKRPEFYHKYDVVKHKQTEKKEIPSECLRTCSECQKIFESIKLRKNHEFIIHGIGEFIKDSGGENAVKGKSVERLKPSSSLREADSKLPEPICPFCGRKLIRYKQAWICGHGCTKPALKPKMKAEPEKIVTIHDPDLLKRLELTANRLKDYQRMAIKYRDEVIPEKDKTIKGLITNLKATRKELIDDVLKDLEELIAWANNYPKDSEIYIRLKRKREKWRGRGK